MSQYQIDSLFALSIWSFCHSIVAAIAYRLIYEEHAWVGLWKLITRQEGGWNKYDTRAIGTNTGSRCCDSADCDGDHEIGAQRIYDGEW
jgi:hypothetical protein